MIAQSELEIAVVLEVKICVSIQKGTVYTHVSNISKEVSKASQSTLMPLNDANQNANTQMPQPLMDCSAISRTQVTALTCYASKIFNKVMSKGGCGRDMFPTVYTDSVFLEVLMPRSSGPDASFLGQPNTGPGWAMLRQYAATMTILCSQIISACCSSKALKQRRAKGRMTYTPSNPMNKPSSWINGPLYPSLNSSIR